VSIIVVYEDNSENVIEKKADVWKNGDDEITLKIDNYKNAIKLILGNKYIPDINFKNNTFLINK
jgi:hypothetical protein